MDKVNLLLPVNSFFIDEDKNVELTAFRLKKNHYTKSFDIKLVNDNKIIKEFNLKKITIKLKKQKDEWFSINVGEGNKKFTVFCKNFLNDEELKKYVDMLVI